MNKELNPKYFNFEEFAIKQLADKIETVFKEVLNTDKLYYYYWSCKGATEASGCCNKHKLIWLGNISLIKYIRTLLRKCKKFNAPVLGVTNIPKKGNFEIAISKADDIIDFFRTSDIFDIWIGDVNRKSQMICGDKLFVILWETLKTGKLTNIED